jgi:anti-sigma regulatory factor (Ser/Thr protein kinase)
MGQRVSTIASAGHLPEGRARGERRLVDQVVTAEVTLPAVPSSVRAARRLLADAARELELSTDVLAIAELALSEVVTNAVVHGTPPITMCIGVDGGHLRIVVSDADPVRPRADETRLDATGGRGLAILTTVAGAWGVESELGGGKSVWFTIVV